MEEGYAHYSMWTDDVSETGNSQRCTLTNAPSGPVLPIIFRQNVALGQHFGRRGAFLHPTLVRTVRWSATADTQQLSRILHALHHAAHNSRIARAIKQRAAKSHMAQRLCASVPKCHRCVDRCAFRTTPNRRRGGRGIERILAVGSGDSRWRASTGRRGHRPGLVR